MPETVGTPLYLTRITLDERHPRVIRAINDLTELHRLVYVGFPDGLPKNDEDTDARVLFRVEIPQLFVQSPLRPDYPLRNGIVSVETQDYCPQLTTGDTLFFRVRTTPTIKRYFGPETNHPGHRRVAIIGVDQQESWLRAILEGDSQRTGIGAQLLLCQVKESKYRTGARPVEDRSRQMMKHASVDFDGVVCISALDSFLTALAKGIGPGKAWGFGLLSIRRMK